MNNEEFIKFVIQNRINRILPKLSKFNIEGDFYIGGNSLNNKINTDIDIYPINDSSLKADEGLIVCKTKNATTYKYGETILQICNYRKNSLEELINSFDYAHIQIGAKIVKMKCSEIYFTDNYICARVIGSSYYVGSEYPLSSLIRVTKYFSGKEMSKGKTIYSILTILIDIIERGFRGYGDFKDQLDAVDLGLIPENLKEVEKCDLLRLFNLLNRG